LEADSLAKSNPARCASFAAIVAESVRDDSLAKPLAGCERLANIGRRLRAEVEAIRRALGNN